MLDANVFIFLDLDPAGSRRARTSEFASGRSRSCDDHGSEAREFSEDFEVGHVLRESGANARAAIGRCEQPIEHALASQAVPRHRFDEPCHGIIAGFDLLHSASFRMFAVMNKTLQERIAELERRLAVIESKSADAAPAWLKNAGWAENDPIYDAAMKLGAQWRMKENLKPARNARGSWVTGCPGLGAMP